MLFKLNRIDEKVDLLSRKVSMILNKSGTGGSKMNVPTLPDGMKLPCDTVKQLKAVSGSVQHDAMARKNLERHVCNFGWCFAKC